MKKRFFVRVILFVLFALIVGAVMVFDGADKSSLQEETITDNYYNNFFGLADGIAEMKDALKRKFNEFIEFVEVKQ